MGSLVFRADTYSKVSLASPKSHIFNSSLSPTKMLRQARSRWMTDFESRNSYKLWLNGDQNIIHCTEIVQLFTTCSESMHFHVDSTFVISGHSILHNSLPTIPLAIWYPKEVNLFRCTLMSGAWVGGEGTECKFGRTPTVSQPLESWSYTWITINTDKFVFLWSVWSVYFWLQGLRFIVTSTIRISSLQLWQSLQSVNSCPADKENRPPPNKQIFPWMMMTL